MIFVVIMTAMPVLFVNGYTRGRLSCNTSKDCFDDTKCGDIGGKCSDYDKKCICNGRFCFL